MLCWQCRSGADETTNNDVLRLRSHEVAIWCQFICNKMAIVWFVSILFSFIFVCWNSNFRRYSFSTDFKISLPILPAPVFSPHSWTTQLQAGKELCICCEEYKASHSVFNIYLISQLYWTLLQRFITMEACVTKVALHISCKGLLDKDSFSKSDPLCAVYIQQGSNWTEVWQNMLMHEQLIFILFPQFNCICRTI